MDRLIKISLLFLIFCIDLNANWKTQRERLDNVYQLDYFRVFYTLKGPDALPKENRDDLNSNYIPDSIENIAQRFKISKYIYIDVLGFQDPLKSKRYEGVKYIDVHVIKSNYSSSSDGIVVYNYKNFKSRDKVLSTKIKNHLRKGSFTPSHEYFHTIQNGYSLFKNRWYTEGTSRWSERVFKKGTGKRKKLPQNLGELRELLKESYDAKYFWRQLTYLCGDNNGVFKLEGEYKIDVPNYPQLIEDNRIYGYNFIRKFLENLDIQDNIASTQRGFNEFSWKENEQKNNEDNNKYILTAVIDTINQSCRVDNQEISIFKKVVKEYLND